MNVEVEIVRETVTTYLVRDVRSLEAAEREALAASTGDKSRVRGGKVRTQEPYVRWSTPVVVRNGRVIREER